MQIAFYLFLIIISLVLIKNIVSSSVYFYLFIIYYKYYLS